jgi:hypothetical protein
MAISFREQQSQVINYSLAYVFILLEPLACHGNLASRHHAAALIECGCMRPMLSGREGKSVPVSGPALQKVQLICLHLVYVFHSLCLTIAYP